MERSTIFHRKTHELNGGSFYSYVSHYQRVISCIAIMAKPIEMVDLPKNIQDGDFPWLCYPNMCFIPTFTMVSGGV